MTQYLLMHKNISVLSLEMEEGYILSINDEYNLEHLPVGVSHKNNMIKSDLRKWWVHRGIPASRDKFIENLRNLGLDESAVSISLAERCLGLSLSDQYWFKPADSSLKWEDVNFFHNEFSQDIGRALFDNVLIENPSLIAPDNTSDGWLKKKWVVIDSERCLIKAGSKPFCQQPYNEVITSLICKRLGITNYVDYKFGIEAGEPVSICCNFITPDTELVSAAAFMESSKKSNSVSEYSHFIGLALQHGITDVQERVDEMLVVDYIIRNEDRHYKNFGLIRNAETLEYVGVAPIFDSGTSLLCNTQTEHIRKECVSASSPSKAFKRTHDESIGLVKNIGRFDLGKLKGIDEEVREILSQGGFITEARTDALCEALSERISKLERTFSAARAPKRISSSRGR